MPALADVMSFCSLWRLHFCDMVLLKSHTCQNTADDIPSSTTRRGGRGREGGGMLRAPHPQQHQGSPRYSYIMTCIFSDDS